MGACTIYILHEMLVSIWLITTTKTFFPTASYQEHCTLLYIYMKIDSRKIFHHHQRTHIIYIVRVRAYTETTDSLLSAFSCTRLFYMQMFEIYHYFAYNIIRSHTYNIAYRLFEKLFFRVFEFLTENHQRNEGGATAPSSTAAIGCVCVENVW